MKLNVTLDLDLDDILEFDEDASDEVSYDVYRLKDSENLQKEVKERIMNKVVSDNFKSSWYPTNAMKDFKTCWKEFLEEHKEEIINAVSQRISASLIRKELKELIK